MEVKKFSILLAVSAVLLTGVVIFNTLPWNNTDSTEQSGIQYPPELISVELTDQSNHTIVVAKYEITNTQWDECVDNGGCEYKPQAYPYTRPNHPVSGVSWIDVQQYIDWLSKKTGQSFRLPTESEWKLLAADVLAKQNAGKKLFDDPRMEWANDYRFFSQRAPRRTQPVGHFGLSTEGIADLNGNVWEWTESCANGIRDSKTSKIHCRGLRVLAGTHVTPMPEIIRYVPIGGCSIGYPPANIGFRVVMDEVLNQSQS